MTFYQKINAKEEPVPKPTPKALPQTLVKPRLGKRKPEPKPVQREQTSWDLENQAEILKEEAEIRNLERKLGLASDAKRKKRNDEQTEKEGMGVGFLSFLDKLDKIAKIDVRQYEKPKEDYKFL